jgi:hypothetical protein
VCGGGVWCGCLFSLSLVHMSTLCVRSVSTLCFPFCVHFGCCACFVLCRSLSYAPRLFSHAYILQPFSHVCSVLCFDHQPFSHVYDSQPFSCAYFVLCFSLACDSEPSSHTYYLLSFSHTWAERL